MKFLDQIHERRIIAVIRLDDLSHAVELTQALIAGGVSIIEFTLTNPHAAQAVADVRTAVGSAGVIGAGSVISAEQVNLVADHGAEFVVSPITKPSVIEACHQRAVPTIPGAYTPTEIQQAWEMDAAAVKVFPAGGLGSRYFKDVLAPLPHLRLIPTGGIDTGNIKEFFDAGVFAVGIGSALFNKADLIAQDWEAISTSARKFSEAMR